MDDPNNKGQVEQHRKMRRELKFSSWLAVGFGIFEIVAGASLYMTFWNWLTNLQHSPYNATANLASATKWMLFALAVSGGVPLSVGIKSLRYLHSKADTGKA